jgi:hypothetical protein
MRTTFRWKADDLDVAGLRTRIGASADGRHTGHADLLREAVDGRVGEASGVARAGELIDARQYVLRSEWGRVQPTAATRTTSSSGYRAPGWGTRRSSRPPTQYFDMRVAASSGRG